LSRSGCFVNEYVGDPPTGLQRLHVQNNLQHYLLTFLPLMMLGYTNHSFGHKVEVPHFVTSFFFFFFFFELKM